MRACPVPISTQIKLAEPPEYRFHKVFSVSFSCLEREERDRQCGQPARAIALPSAHAPGLSTAGSSALTTYGFSHVVVGMTPPPPWRFNKTYFNELLGVSLHLSINITFCVGVFELVSVNL